MMNFTLTPIMKEYNRNKSITNIAPILLERGEWQVANNSLNILEDEIANTKMKFYIAILVVSIISIGGIIFNNKITDKSLINKSDREEVLETNISSEEIKKKIKKLEELRENNLIDDKEFQIKNSKLINEFLE